jgi:hypothetical protein
MIKNVTLFLLLVCVSGLAGQVPKFPVINIPVERNGLLLQNPWTGGMNAPQFSPIDLNNDGIQDLFVFDRGGDKVLTFINDGSHSDTAFHFAPEYIPLFPAMHVWAVIRDYNHDGIPDIFTDQVGETDPMGHTVPAGIKVYKGSRVNGNLHFDVLQYCMYYYSAPYTVPLWVNGLGLPAIIDVNHDGDLDVLAFNTYGTAVEYYENQTVELGRDADSLWFYANSLCWGNFYISSPDIEPSLDVSCKGGAPGGSTGRHTGSALSAFDNQGDGDIDLLVSGVHVNYMDMLNNTGNANYANIGWVDSLWPSCSVPVHLPNFPGAYGVDADNDGLSDMLVAPIFSSPALDKNNVVLYKNVQGDTCRYRYSGNDSFLVSSFIDLGTASKGVFFDYNGDGLMDIVVGNYYLYNPVVAGVSGLALYENTGTPTQPRYKEITTDFAGVSVYSSANNFLSANPAFGDLDGDGKPDMLIGDNNGDIHFFKNTGSNIAAFPVMTNANYFGINAGAYAAPFIYDLNGDSLPDIVVGRADGKLSYYWNFGSKTNPLFNTDSVNVAFGDVNVTLATTNTGSSQPFIMRDSTGGMLLFVGSERGTVFEYMIDTARLKGGSFLLIDSDYLKYNAGTTVTMQAWDLNGDGKPEYLLGNSLGGLQLFSETVWDSSVVLKLKDTYNPGRFSIFPNPAGNVVYINVADINSNNLQAELFNMLGERVLSKNAVNDKLITLDVAGLETGIYIAKIYSAGYSFTGKLIIQH